PLSSGRDAGRELSGHQQDTDRSDGLPAVQEHVDPRPARGARRRGSEDHGLPDTSAPGALVQIVGWYQQEPELPGSGTADARALKDGRRRNLLPRGGLPRPERSQED